MLVLSELGVHTMPLPFLWLLSMRIITRLVLCSTLNDLFRHETQVFDDNRSILVELDDIMHRKLIHHEILNTYTSKLRRK